MRFINNNIFVTGLPVDTNELKMKEIIVFYI